MPVLIPMIVLLGLGVGVSIAVAAAYLGEERALPNYQPDEQAQPALGKTGYKLVDKLLPKLRAASSSSGVPLGVLVGWIASESGGRIGAAPRVLKGQTDSERGLFQLHPDESKSLGLDHKRLSEDENYSINGGLALIAKNMGRAEKFGIAPKGSAYFWLLVKFIHSIGVGAATKIVEKARAAGETGTWNRLNEYAVANEKELFSLVKHSPTKWFGLTNKVYRIGAPFGFGSGDVVVGGQVFDDIVDPIDALRII